MQRASAILLPSHFLRPRHQSESSPTLQPPVYLRAAIRARDSFVFALEEVVRSLKSICLRSSVWLALVLWLGPAKVHAQGAAPETAPPLFPGGGLVSYNSVFTTRGLMPSASSGIPASAFPTLSHEGSFNFTWGFHPDLDLTVLLPIVTTRYEASGVQMQGGTGIGDMMVL